MVGWHHQLNGHESEQTLGDSEGQGRLAYCSPSVTKSRTRLSEQQQYAITLMYSTIYYSD